MNCLAAPSQMKFSLKQEIFLHSIEEISTQIYFHQMPAWWNLGGLAVAVLPFTMVGGRQPGNFLETSNIILILSRHKIRTLSNVIPFSHESCQLASKSFHRCLTIVMTNSFCCFLFFIHNTIITNWVILIFLKLQ